MRYLDERMRDLNRLLREIIQQEQRRQGAEPRDFSQRSTLADEELLVLHQHPAHERRRGAPGAKAEKPLVGAAQEGCPRPLRY